MQMSVYLLGTEQNFAELGASRRAHLINKGKDMSPRSCSVGQQLPNLMDSLYRKVECVLIKIG